MYGVYGVDMHNFTRIFTEHMNTGMVMISLLIDFCAENISIFIFVTRFFLSHIHVDYNLFSAIYCK